MMPISHLHTLSLHDQRVILRADLNVPLAEDGTIANDFKLRALKPTLDLLMQRGCTVTLISHLGNPEGHDKRLSLQHLISWFASSWYKIFFAATLHEAHQLLSREQGCIVLLENLRFWPAEKENDAEFAKKLALLGSYYISDAWGSIHRTAASLVALPDLFDAQHKTFGLLIENELNALAPVRTNPTHPFAVIVGGAKVSDKLPFLLSMCARADTIIVNPALSDAFFDVENPLAAFSKRITAEAATAGTQLIVPIDFLFEKKDALQTAMADQIPSRAAILSMGPASVSCYKSILANTNTIFYNGPSGFIQKPATMQYTNELLTFISQHPGRTIIGGGDAIAAVFALGLQDQFSFLSSGGGATLAYIAHQAVPHLDCLLKDRAKAE